MWKWAPVALLIFAGTTGLQAQTLPCGAISVSIQTDAYQLGQACGPKTFESGQQSLGYSHLEPGNCNKVNAYKRMQSSCNSSNGSVTISIGGDEWGNLSGEHAEDRAQTRWDPTWSATLEIPGSSGKKLNWELAADLKFLHCNFTGFDKPVAWDTAGPHRAGGQVNLSAATNSFTPVLVCSSPGLHQISPAVLYNWINPETIQLSLTIR